jgi:hypothetical protein
VYEKAADQGSREVSFPTSTLLKVLLRQQHRQRYETFCVEYQRAAGQVSTSPIAPSKAQFHRWLSGQLKGGVPYPDACRVLETMFPPWSAADLCGPYDPSQHPVGTSPRSSAATDSRPPRVDVLGSIPNSFSATALEGAWVTCFDFTHHHTNSVKYHADIVRVSAESDRRVLTTNHPPEPRTEDRGVPFRNEIEALLVNRHLVGNWKNLSDARYFGTLHLAILPGETVMDGHYTGFASDIEVITGSWKWVRLEHVTIPPKEELAEVVLKEPQEIHSLLANHSQYDGPMPLIAVKESN